MNDQVYDELLRLSLRRELSVDDEVRVEMFLAAHPELREQWEQDVAVGRALRTLPDVPVSSNFNARVLQAIDSEERRGERAAGARRVRWTNWFRPRVNWAVVLALAITFAIHQHNTSRRKAMVNDVRIAAGTFAVLPDPRALADFDAVKRLGHVPTGSDDELLLALTVK